MRFACGVAKHGLSASLSRGHQSILRRGYAGFIEEDVGPLEGARLQLVVGADLDIGTELLESEEMRVQPPATDHVSAGRR